MSGKLVWRAAGWLALPALLLGQPAAGVCSVVPSASHDMPDFPGTSLPVHNITQDLWYALIQDALNAAAAGDEIEISPGTYTGAGNRDLSLLGKALTLRSSDPTDPAVVAGTILDCAGTASEPHSAFVLTSGEPPEALIDGLTMINGYGHPGGGQSNGGGVYCASSSPTFKRCVIRNNNASTSPGADIGTGAGVYCSGGSPTFSDCTIQDNFEWGGGDAGGVYCDAVNAVFDHCAISGNYVDHGEGGGIFCVGRATITNCIITDNMGYLGGGGICCDGDTVVQNCTIGYNQSRDGFTGGGGILVRGTAKIRDSLVVGNYCRQPGQSGGIQGGSAQSVIADCVVSENEGSHGGGIGQFAGLIERCIITGNIADDGGGLGQCSGAVRDCMIAGNDAFGGAALSLDAVAVNCLLTGNGGPFAVESGSGSLTNCVIADNDLALYHYNGTIVGSIIGPDQLIVECSTPTYSCLADGVDGGEGNIPNTPGFMPGHTGIWTAAATYDPATYRSVLVDATATWHDGQWVGRLLNPDTGQIRQFYVAANTATSLTIWGDARSIAQAGDPYQLLDYRLAPGSPCIDAGKNEALPVDISTDLAGHVRFRDDPARLDTGLGTPPLIDMGAYEFLRGDMNCDGVVDDQDITPYVEALLQPDQYPLDFPDCSALSADFDGDGLVNNQDIDGFIIALFGG